MKRFLAIILSCALVLTGCTSVNSSNTEEQSTQNNDTGTYVDVSELEQEIDFEKLSDPDLLTYVENSVYTELVETLDSKEYFVENVEAVYYSKEYLEELEYNSQSNIYFGFTLAEIDKYFDGEKYIFTLGDDGQTVVKAFEHYDDTYEQALMNVATGAGIIFICVTVSVVSGGTAPAVSMIFAASAKTGTAMALSSGALGSVASGIVTGIETKDFDETLKSMALAGSEGFKWGVITGVVSGGATQAFALKGATCNGLTMNQAATIQQESGLPLEFIKSFHSVDEYNIYKNAGLQVTKVNGKYAYVQNIDWDYVDSQGRTNAQRVIDGYAPLDSTGKSYELHHIGQKADSPLAILTNAQHHGNDSILHDKSIESKINRNEFNAYKKIFWKKLLEMSQTVS